MYVTRIEKDGRSKMAYPIHPQFDSVNICYMSSAPLKGWGFMSNHALILNQNHMEVSVRVQPAEAELESVLKVNCEIISYVTYRV